MQLWRQANLFSLIFGDFQSEHLKTYWMCYGLESESKPILKYECPRGESIPIRVVGKPQAPIS